MYFGIYQADEKPSVIVIAIPTKSGEAISILECVQKSEIASSPTKIVVARNDSERVFHHSARATMVGQMLTLPLLLSNLSQQICLRREPTIHLL